MARTEAQIESQMTKITDLASTLDPYNERDYARLEKLNERWGELGNDLDELRASRDLREDAKLDRKIQKAIRGDFAYGFEAGDVSLPPPQDNTVFAVAASLLALGVAAYVDSKDGNY